MKISLLPLTHKKNTSNTDNMLTAASKLVGYQSGFTGSFSSNKNDDSFPASFIFDAQHNLVYFTGVTYSTFFDKTEYDLPPDVLGAMGMSTKEASSVGDDDEYHLTSGDCFLGILKLFPSENKNGPQAAQTPPKLIYAKRFGTPQNSEACSSLLMLPHTVQDALLHSSSQLKLILLGHVNPVPLSADEIKLFKESMQQQQQHKNNGQNQRLLEKQEINQGGFFTSLSHDNDGSSFGGPLTHNGRAYGFAIDFDLTLTPTPEFEIVDSSPTTSSSKNNQTTTITATTTNNLDFNYAYGALLGGYVLESSPLVYPIDLTQNSRDPNQLYIVSMHSDNQNEVYNDEYPTSVEQEMNVELHSRPDITLGGAGGYATALSSSVSASSSRNGQLFVGGVPKYGSNFYVKIQHVTITPYEQLLNVTLTKTEHVKNTMTSGWGFGFKLNDAVDVRPSCVEFVRGRTPDEDLLLLAGTTRKLVDGDDEYDGFITKLIPPAPAPVLDMTTGATFEEATSSSSSSGNSIQTEAIHPTKRIDSTTGRDETVAAICLPPPGASGMVGVTHAFVVGSSTNSKGGEIGPSLAYLLKMKLSDMSTVWKKNVPSISSNGSVGGDVLGQGCAVSHDGKVVYLSGTIDGTSAVQTGAANSNIKPVGGMSDIFVVAYDTELGNVKWEQQLGTKYEDMLARGGGISVDNDGNAMIMGSSRGALQRFREENGRMSSDIFFMSLSRENGAHVNAPFTDGPGSTGSAGSSSNGALAGIVVSVTTLLSVLLVVIFRRRRRKLAKKGGVSRMWDRRNDDYSFSDKPSSTVESPEDRTSSGALRIVRGGLDDDSWDDGFDRMNRANPWKRIGSSGSENSSSSKRSYEKEDNASFLAKLREERSSNNRLSTMINISDATDPRLDDGASIKNLLSQYREVKKGSIISDDDGRVFTVRSGKKSKAVRPPPPPPPPPPRRGYDGEPDGLSEFTIV